MTHTTAFTRPDGIRLELTGDRLYRVTVNVEDGQTFTAVVAASREGSARTRAMAVCDLRLNGQDVTYEIEEVDAA